jgi:predicted RNA-binding protein YlxR (DUF448 family)
MERTCLVTKIKAHQGAFFRFTIQAGQLVFDTVFKAAGRGGYVVKDVSALDKLPKLAGKIAYFLKVKKVEVAAEEIERVKTLI